MLALVALAHAGVLRHALVVGANYGGTGLDPLRYAESDAQRVGELLAELGGFDPALVTVLYTPAPGELAEAFHRHATLALAPGNYRVRLQQGRDFREPEIMLTDGARMTLSRWGAANVEAGTPKGAVLALDARDLARKTAEHGLTWLDRNVNPYDLRHSPILAGGTSALAPGGGVKEPGR